MTETTETAHSAPPLSRRQRKRAIAAWEAQRRREVEQNLAVLRARRAVERTERIQRHLIDLWPLWLGIFLGLLGPIFQDVATSIGPWCMTLVYPFVMLARRPEIQVGPITHVLPTAMLYAQFPIEGLLARIVLRRHVRPISVIWQVSLFHFLGLMELWMLSGGAAVLLGR